MKLLHRTIVISALLGLSILVVGCSKPEPTVVTAPTESGGGPPTAGADGAGAKSGNVINTTLMPAPNGTKTGVEGGKKD